MTTKQPIIRVYLREEHRKAFMEEVKSRGLNFTQFVAVVLEDYLTKKQALAGRTELEAFGKYLQTKEGSVAAELSGLIGSFERLIEKRIAKYKPEPEE